MAVSSVTHLNFRGAAREALAFYQSVFGGELVSVPHADDESLVMWGQVAAANGFRVMAYDVPSGMPYSPGENAFFVSVRGETAEEVVPFWDGLSDGARIHQPLGPSAWAPVYGMLTDRFGVTWVIDVSVAG
ncbi:VOC family protein [Nonomuraea sp. NPDC050663]|uniref:VOC family protein n=1 Tax=Nonomuraea sp. NPDC050663 TaxID=3364370 RepID=UPI0037B504CE